jgi:probable RNA-binding protein EIF1AD
VLELLKLRSQQNQLHLPKMPRPKRDIQAVAQETLTPPDVLPTSQTIARVRQAAGNNLYLLELPSTETLLAELPARFRSTIWIKRGSFVLVDTTSLADRDNKLGGEIVNVVRDEKAWRKMAYWPSGFPAKVSPYAADSDDEGPKMPPSDSEDEQT